MPQGATVTLWTDGQHAGAAQRLLHAMGPALRLVGVGGPPMAEVADLARAAGLDPTDDFRSLTRDSPADFLLLMTPQGVRRDEVFASSQRGVRALVWEPLALNPDDLPDPRVTTDPRPIPLAGFTRSQGFRSAADPHEVLAPLRLIQFQSFGRAIDRSLYARLDDAWRVALHFLDLPLEVNARLTGPLASPPDELDGLTGQLAVQAITADNCTLALQLSDRAGSPADPGRSLDVIGEGGHLHATDSAYRLHDKLGLVMDRQRDAPASDLLSLACDHWKQLLHDRPEAGAGEPRSGGRDPHPDHDARVLACCLATLLSARTGSSERPDPFLAGRSTR